MMMTTQSAPSPEYVPLPTLLLVPPEVQSPYMSSKVIAHMKKQGHGKIRGELSFTMQCEDLMDESETQTPDEGYSISANIDGSDVGRWWATLPMDVLCPISNFPIKLLPYPPFRWQAKVGIPKNRIYIDGKLLALQLIIDEFNGQVTTVCGRKPVISDIHQLDDYIRRCKLGPFKVTFVRHLAQQVVSSGTGGQCSQAYRDLLLFVDLAMREMKRIHGIQHSRMGKIMRNKRGAC